MAADTPIIEKGNHCHDWCVGGRLRTGIRLGGGGSCVQGVGCMGNLGVDGGRLRGDNSRNSLKLGKGTESPDAGGCIK